MPDEDTSEEVEIYVIRHGLAAERGDAFPDDTKRPLTHRGIERLRQQAEGLNRAGVGIDLILTSPLVRARQTADALAAVLKSRPAIVNIDALAPGGSHSAIIDEIAKHARKKRLGLVGHEPGVGELAARLIGLRKPLAFKKGAICRIDLLAVPPAGPGQLRWFLTPRLARTLGR